MPVQRPLTGRLAHVDHPCSNAEVCPIGPGRVLPAGVVNVSCIQEGWSSVLHWNGTQHRMATFIRTDGNSESSMGLAAAAALLPAGPVAVAGPGAAERARWAGLASQLQDYMWRWGDSQVLRPAAF